MSKRSRLFDDVQGGPPAGDPPPPDEISWEEAEGAMRQLEKELHAASRAHAALRKAREAGEATAHAEREHARLTAEIETLVIQHEAERGRFVLERSLMAAALAEQVSTHDATATAMAQEIADLERELVAARQRTLDRNALERKDHDLLVAEQDAQIAGLNQEKARIEALIVTLKANVGALV